MGNCFSDGDQKGKQNSFKRRRDGSRASRRATARYNGQGLGPEREGEQLVENGHVDHIHADDDFVSCRDDFSVTDGSHLDSHHVSPQHSGHFSPIPPVSSLPTNLKVSRRASATTDGLVPSPNGTRQSAANQSPTQSPAQHQDQSPNQPRHSGSLSGTSEDEEDESPSENRSTPLGRFSACLPILDLGGGGGKSTPPRGQDGRTLGSQRSKRQAGRPEAGCSMQARDLSKSALDVSYCYEDGSSSVFNIRSINYMKTKVKIPSSSAMYQLAAADIFATPTKTSHIARLLHLPPHGSPVLAGDVALPPMLIFNLQLPLYPAPIFGPYDGPGVSIVFYFRLPEAFDPAAFDNQKALALFKRFISGGREADGSPSRDRLKLIPRVVNVDEWVRKGPLSQAEHQLLLKYNDKPILSRPQHEFHVGRNYFEVDFDLHTYTYLARRAITTYLLKLPQVVWENAFVVQGNSPDELPEHLLGVARVYRFDFCKAKPIPTYEPPPSGDSDGAGVQADSRPHSPVN